MLVITGAYLSFFLLLAFPGDPVGSSATKKTQSSGEALWLGTCPTQPPALYLSWWGWSFLCMFFLVELPGRQLQSLTWIKEIWGWFPLLTIIYGEVVVRSCSIYPDICFQSGKMKWIDPLTYLWVWLPWQPLPAKERNEGLTLHKLNLLLFQNAKFWPIFPLQDQSCAVGSVGATILHATPGQQSLGLPMPFP